MANTIASIRELAQVPECAVRLPFVCGGGGLLLNSILPMPQSPRRAVAQAWLAFVQMTISFLRCKGRFSPAIAA